MEREAPGVKGQGDHDDGGPEGSVRPGSPTLGSTPTSTTRTPYEPPAARFGSPRTPRAPSWILPSGSLGRRSPDAFRDEDPTLPISLRPSSPTGSGTLSRSPGSISRGSGRKGWSGRKSGETRRPAGRRAAPRGPLVEGTVKRPEAPTLDPEESLMGRRSPDQGWRPGAHDGRGRHGSSGHGWVVDGGHGPPDSP